MRIGLLIFFLAVLVNDLYSQTEISSGIDRDSIQIGEQLRVYYDLKSDKALASVVPDFNSAIGTGIELLQEASDSVRNDLYHYSYIYTITSFDSGVYEISPVEFLINDGRKADTLLSGSLAFRVFTPEVDTAAAIRDLKDPLNTPLSFSEILEYWPYYVPVIAVIVGIILVILLLKRRKKLPEAETIIPAHIRALVRLDEIRDEKKWQSGQVKEYYTELSDTVRQYIEDRFNIPAMESVTHEIISDFKKFSYDDDYLLEILENMLNLSDLVKFAREDPSPAENETNLSQAYILVEKTKPVEELKKEEE